MPLGHYPNEGIHDMRAPNVFYTVALDLECNDHKGTDRGCVRLVAGPYETERWASRVAARARAKQAGSGRWHFQTMGFDTHTRCDSV